MKTKASETVLRSSSSSGTGFSSARSASPRKRAIGQALRGSGRVEGDAHHRPGHDRGSRARERSRSERAAGAGSRFARRGQACGESPVGSELARSAPAPAGTRCHDESRDARESDQKPRPANVPLEHAHALLSAVESGRRDARVSVGHTNGRRSTPPSGETGPSNEGSRIGQTVISDASGRAHVIAASPRSARTSPKKSASGFTRYSGPSASVRSPSDVSSATYTGASPG